VDLLAGMLVGMGGFIAFCAVVAVFAVPAGIVIAFAAATLLALGVQGCVLTRAW
jgi:hypothetical protein